MDIFLEQIVTRRRRALYELLFYACWVLLVLCAIVGLSGLVNIVYTGADGGLGFRPLAAGMAVVFLGGAFLLAGEHAPAHGVRLFLHQRRF